MHVIGTNVKIICTAAWNQ